jgi:hypothetical protein
VHLLVDAQAFLWKTISQANRVQTIGGITKSVGERQFFANCIEGHQATYGFDALQS